MSENDFLSVFTKLEICNFTTDDFEQAWVAESFEGSWIKNKSAGGCRNYLGKCFLYKNLHTMLTNKLYFLKII